MPRFTARDLRTRNEWDVELEPGWTVHVRRLDMVSAYMQNLIPMPLMAALDRLRAQSEKIARDPSLVMAVPQQDKEQTIELLRRYACAAVVDPHFVMEEDGDPDHAPITLLSSEQLLKIWQSSPRRDTLPEVSPATADVFRQRRESAETPAAVSPEPQIPSAAELVSTATAIVESQYF